MEQALMAVSGNMPVRTILTAYTRSPASPFYCRARKSMSLQIRRGCGAIRRRGRPPKPHVALASRAKFWEYHDLLYANRRSSIRPA